jgi:hypothetical protein
MRLSETIAKEIGASIEIKCTIVCYYCGAVGVWTSSDFCPDQTERSAALDAAEAFVKRGWMLVSSRTFQVHKAIRCPACTEFKR